MTGAQLHAVQGGVWDRPRGGNVAVAVPPGLGWDRCWNWPQHRQGKMLSKLVIRFDLIMGSARWRSRVEVVRLEKTTRRMHASTPASSVCDFGFVIHL